MCPRGQLVVSRDWGGDGGKVLLAPAGETRNTAKYPPMHRTAPPTNNKKMSSPQTAEIEKFSPKMIFNLLFHTKISLTGGCTKAQLFSVNSYQLTTTSHTDGSHLNVCKIPCPSFSIPSRHPQPMTDGYRDTKAQTPIFQEEKTLWCHLCSRATVGSS